MPPAPNQGGAEPAGVWTSHWTWLLVVLRANTAGSATGPPL